MREADAWEDYGNRGDGPDDRGNCFGWNAEHPSYDDDEVYKCSSCGARLIESRDAIAEYNPHHEPVYMRVAVGNADRDGAS